MVSDRVTQSTAASTKRGSSLAVIPAAQYLRMSNDSQEYSIHNQEKLIAAFAEAHAYRIVSTYSDPGRSGLTLEQRPGLQSLLRDILNRPHFRAVLVYDVSRWGRFQDTDESAHYEFMCESAGIPVIYCSEEFASDGNTSGQVLKALKRAMAGEYSRELSEKVFRGQQNLAKAGHRLGGPAPFGLRRLLLSRSGSPKRELQRNEFKSAVGDFTTLCLGPKEEVKTVRLVFRLAARQGLTPYEIARVLQQKKVPSPSGRPWNGYRVYTMLKNCAYMGWFVWGQRTVKLHGPTVRKRVDDWIVRPDAFPAIVSRQTFTAAQSAMHYFPRRKRRTNNHATVPFV